MLFSGRGADPQRSQIHLTFFTVTPFILSGIFYAANGQIKHEWVDCLFMVTSALCVVGASSGSGHGLGKLTGAAAGLNTVVLSELTAFQQAMLFVSSHLLPVATSRSSPQVSTVLHDYRLHELRLDPHHPRAEVRRPRGPLDRAAAAHSSPHTGTSSVSSSSTRSRTRLKLDTV